MLVIRFFRTPGFFASILFLPFLYEFLATTASDLPDPNRREFGGIPVLCGDSDIGFGFGALFSMAGYREHYDPYVWRMECMIMMSAKSKPYGGIELPYHDDYIRLDFPSVTSGKLRLFVDLGFGRYLTSGYYGLGNASQAVTNDSPRFYQYDHANIHLRLRALMPLCEHLRLMSGCTIAKRWIALYDGSLLQRDARSADPKTTELLKGAGPHGIAEFDLGCILDTRNNEIAPTQGMFHELSVRGSPWLATADGVAYCGVNATARLYRGIFGEKLVAAGRVVSDLLFGRPPFYELCGFGGLTPNSGIGGGNAIRGVPMGRYYGKAKLFANAELRSKLIDFRVVKQGFNLGVIEFVDAGRTWADYSGTNRLDGNGLDLKYGAGGGLRLQWGETFLLRIDVAWSPDADPVGFYVDVNHVF